MQIVKLAKARQPKRAHVIEGTWATKEIRIDGHRLSLEMVKVGRRRDGLSDDEQVADVQTFAWGADAPQQTLRVLAYACGASTMPKTWSPHSNSAMALEEFFLAQLHQLPAADFTLRYTEQELRQAIQHIKLLWNEKVKAM